MRVNTSYSSHVYQGCHFLCYLNIKTTTGWLVCNYDLKEGFYPVHAAVLKFLSGNGTTTLVAHMRTHKRNAFAGNASRHDGIRIDLCFT